MYSIRGNHDARFTWSAEIQLSLANEGWEMPSLYYSKLVQVGPNGEMMGLLFIDS